MSKQEVENLSNEDLLKAWEEIRTAYRSLFADFVNVSRELKKRGIETEKLQS